MADEDVMQKSESWYSARWNHLPAATLVVDAQSRCIVEANAMMGRMCGRESDTLVGVCVTELLPEMLDAGLRLLLANPSENGISIRTQLKMQDGSGIPVWVVLSRPFDFEGRSLIVGEVRNAAREVDMEDRLAAKRWALRAYASAALTLVSAKSSATLLQDICEAITQDSPFLLAYVGFFGPAPDYMVTVKAKAGQAADYLDGIEISGSKDRVSGQGPVGMAFRSGVSQVIEDVDTDPRYAPWRDLAHRYGIRSSMTVPFPISAGEIGVLGVNTASRNAFGPVVREAFEHLAQEITVGMESLRQREQIDRERLAREEAQQSFVNALTAAVGAIAGAVEAGDPFTAGHQRRVSKVACNIGRAMGWSEYELQGLEMAAMVHDIGKLAVPQQILNKPGRLTPEEFARVKVHVNVGYRILKDIPFPWPVAGMAWQHHEKLDGSGYPLGLKGDAILPGARILAVADIVESMACDRPYRKALGVDVALQEVESLAAQGKLDAEVVKACVRLFREEGYQLPRAEEDEYLHAEMLAGLARMDNPSALGSLSG